MYLHTFVYNGGSSPGAQRRIVSIDLPFIDTPHLLQGIDIDDEDGVFKKFSKDKIKKLETRNLTLIKDYLEDVSTDDVIDVMSELMRDGKIVHCDDDTYVVDTIAMNRKNVVVGLEGNIFKIIANLNAVKSHQIEIQKGSISNPSVTILGEGTQYNSTHQNTVTELYTFLTKLKKEGYF